MVEPVNLRQFRKRKQREEKERKADENRKLFGTSTKLKKLSKAKNLIEANRLEGAKLERSTSKTGSKTSSDETES